MSERVFMGVLIFAFVCVVAGFIYVIAEDWLSPLERRMGDKS